jgi:tetratricopeptide (TPR) repeat protein
MELQKKSELSVGTASFVVTTSLQGDTEPLIETRVLGSDGSVVFRTVEDISSLKPIFQNSQKVSARLEEQHRAVVTKLEEGQMAIPGTGPGPETASTGDRETDALAHAVRLLGGRTFDKAIAALRAILETYPNCSEARELLEVAYKASSGPRLGVDLILALKRGTEAFADGRPRDAIESWKLCLIEEPDNRRVQLLVLLATTWSPTRRKLYAAEILARGTPLLSSGRPEEVQALLLVTQTVEGAAPPPDQTLVQPSKIEDLVADTAVEVSPPEDELMSFPDPVPEPAPEPLPEPEPEAELESHRQPMIVEASPPPPPLPQPERAPAPPAPPAAPKPRPPAASAPRVAGPRKPPVPVRREIPWGMIGAGLAAVVVIGLGVLWMTTRSRSVSAEDIEHAASLVSSGQFPQAIQAYDSLLTDFGDSAPVYLGRGRAKLASGDASGGLADLERAHSLDPQSAPIAEELGDVLYSQGEFSRAIGFYEKAFAGGAGSAEARYRSAVSLYREGRAEEALTHLGAAVAKDPQHGEAQFLYGQLLNARGRHQEAEKALRSAEKHVEAGGDFLHQLAIAVLEQGKLEEAEEIAADFLRAYPSDARARSLFGEIYLSRRQLEAARAHLIQALRMDPNEPRAQLALGRTWLAIGKSRRDKQDLAKAKQVLASARGVDEGERLLALGQVALAEEKLEEAASLLQQASERGAPELAVHLSLAETRWKAEDLVGAAEELQKASALVPGDPAVSLSLAIAYFQLKDTSRSADQFLKAIQGIGLVNPPGEGNGPVIFPEPYVPVPDRFNVNKAIKESVAAVLRSAPEDPTATQLRTFSESTTFLVGGEN